MSSIVNKVDKPWSVDQFEEYRPHMTAFVRSKVVPLLNHHDVQSRNRLLIHGQVKVGKREIVEYIAVRDAMNQSRVHVFISSFHRKADESQRDELDAHNIKVCSISNKSRRDAAIREIMAILANPNMYVVIHWDECDYGTGDRQNLAGMYRQFRDHPRVFNIMYSATPEEMLYSTEIAANTDPENTFISDFYEDGSVVKYIPPAGYCGAQKFLDNGLVFQAMPFFENCGSVIRLSEQAKTILSQAAAGIRIANRLRRNLQNDLEDAQDTGDAAEVERIKNQMSRITIRNIIPLRLSYCENDDDDDEENEEFDDIDSVDSAGSKRNKAIYSFLKYSQFVEELKECNIVADKPDVKELDALPNVETRVVQWGKKKFWDGITKDKLVIVVHDQTSTRSTEWACHDRVFATHDYRKRLTFNTVAQAQLRPAHYEQNYGGFQPIRIYGDLRTFKFVVGQITAAEYLHSEWQGRKVPKSDPPRYRIKNIMDSKKPMPVVSISIGGASVQFVGIPDPTGYSFEVKEKLLVQLGGGIFKVSQRVRGNSKRIPVIKSKFFRCDPGQKIAVVDSIYEDPEVAAYLNEHRFNASALFTRSKLVDGQEIYEGYLRGRKVLQYEELKTELWGIRIGVETARLTECYDREGNLGLCLRVATGEFAEANDLEAYMSMYQKNE